MTPPATAAPILDPSTVDAWRDYLTATGKAQSTIGEYTFTVRTFAESAHRQGCRRWADVTRRTWRGYLATAGLAASTAGTRLSALKAFGAWCVDTGRLTTNPWRHVKPPRKPHRLPRVLSVRQCERIMHACHTPRERAVCETLWASGVRVAELVGLDVADLDLPHRRGIVLGKGGRERTVLLTPLACEAVAEYLEHRPREYSGPAVFVTRGYRGQAVRRISKRLVGIIVDRVAGRAGVPGVTPHVFRHSFATQLLEGGANLREVQTLLGHKKVTTTQVYLHVSAAHLRRTVDAAHPLAPTS